MLTSVTITPAARGAVSPAATYVKEHKCCPVASEWVVVLLDKETCPKSVRMLSTNNQQFGFDSKCDFLTYRVSISGLFNSSAVCG